MAVESARAESQTPQARLADLPSGIPDLSLAGADAAGDFRCADCGYGVAIQRSLPVCPMCGGTIWKRTG